MPEWKTEAAALDIVRFHVEHDEFLTPEDREALRSILARCGSADQEEESRP